jgi:hypothetical protein
MEKFYIIFKTPSKLHIMYIVNTIETCTILGIVKIYRRSAVLRCMIRIIVRHYTVLK